jgi:hypothetical protein
MTQYDCSICNFKGRDNNDLTRHNESQKHLSNCPKVGEEVKDIRLMNEIQTREYIKKHKWFIEADPEMADYRQKEDRYNQVRDILENSKSTKTITQIEEETKAIQDEYSDNEDESEESMSERLRRIDALNYNYSKDELDKLIIEKDDLLHYLNDSFHQKKGSFERHAKLREKIRTKMMDHLEAVDKKKQMDEMKEADSLEKLERQKQELELKIKLLELNMLKKRK